MMSVDIPQDMFNDLNPRKRTTVDQLSQASAAAAEAQGFGVMHQYAVQQVLEKKGFPIAARCRVFEIGNSRQASELLAAAMPLNMALPCRVSVYELGGPSVMGIFLPKELLALVSEKDAIANWAQELEIAMMAMIDALAGGSAGTSSSHAGVRQNGRVCRRMGSARLVSPMRSLDLARGP